MAKTQNLKPKKHTKKFDNVCKVILLLRLQNFTKNIFLISKTFKIDIIYILT